ncbi:MAG: hypothetical protein P1U40_05525 [Coxiellaceae bacterium]|nr:hypothetical protein [Coxiellaceae bacterium]
MIISLLEQWRTLSSMQGPKALIATGPVGAKFDSNTRQLTMTFEHPPKVLFVKDPSLELANDYDDLPALALTPDEEATKQAHFETLLKKATDQGRTPPYDGNQMLVTDMLYDDSLNRIYVVAVRTSYAFIAAHSSKKFGLDSRLNELQFFKTGVIAPLIAQDDSLTLLERAQFGLHSGPSGFLEPLPVGGELRLNFEGGDLISHTATKEIFEEIAGDGTEPSHEQSLGHDLSGRRFHYKTPVTTALSVRQTNTSTFLTAEFIAPTVTHCLSGDLPLFAKDNEAKDAEEHTSNSLTVSLRPEHLPKLLSMLYTTDRPFGGPLYTPMILASLRALYGDKSPMPRCVPGTDYYTIPVSHLFPALRRPLALCDEESKTADLTNPGSIRGI